MRVKIFVGSPEMVEDGMNAFFAENDISQISIAQSMHQESSLDCILTITLVYDYA